MTMNWFGEAAHRKMKAEIYAPGIQRGIRIIRDEAKELLNTDQPISGAGIRRRGLDPSSPGEPPKKVSAELIKGVAAEYNPGLLRGRTGTNVKHGKFMELGTVHIKRRPWLSTAVSNTRTKVGRGFKRKAI